MKFDTTLSVLDSPYRVIGYFEILSGDTLHLEAGSKIITPSGITLFVRGGLHAEGNKDNPIIFTSRSDTLLGWPETGDWGGLYAYANSSVYLNCCEVKYANNGVYLNDQQSAVIAGCKIHHCATGVYAYRDPTLYMTGSELYNNISNDIHLQSYYSEYFKGQIHNNNIYNNGGTGAFGIYCGREGTGSGGGSIDALSNWWRYSDSTIIENSFVFDHLDDANLPRVISMPFVADTNMLPCESDFDFTGRIDYDDLIMLGFSFGSIFGELNWIDYCNISQVGASEQRIDGLDLAFFGSQYGKEGGCYPFYKLLEADLPADSFTIVITKTQESNNTILTLTPIIPEDYNLFGVMFDIIGNIEIADKRELESLQQKLLNKGIALLSSVEDNKSIIGVVSLNREPIDDEDIQEVIQFTFPKQSIDDLKYNIENVSLVVDNYRLVISPRIMEGEVINKILPERFEVFQNYPNPFNLETVISYALDKKSDVRINIFNILGQTVQSYFYPQQSPGFYDVAWNGSDRDGRAITSGIYFYRIESTSNSHTRKMVLLK